MEEGASNRPTDTPEGSAGPEDISNAQSGSAKNATAKDRKCQYCHQAFTSSSLGRHLDQFLFKKKPDGIHDVEEIRRIRSGITRRQARTSSGKRDTPERSTGNGQLDSYHDGEPGAKPRDGIRMMFNTPTWHATGVINDIPNPSQSQDNTGPSRFSSSQSRAPKPLPDYASRGASANNPDTMRALELALREVLDNIKAATSRMRPRLSPFDFEIQSQTFPSLCLQLLPPPPSLFAASPFPSHSSFSLQPPGVEHVEIVRQALRAKIDQWQSDQLSADSMNNSQSRPSIGLDANMIARSAQQHEDISLRHLELAFKHWASLTSETRRDAWQLEITRAFAREMEKRKSLDDQLARVQQEANQLRAQVERLGSCQWPREFALFPPDTLPLPRDVARELDANESKISPESSRWDYDSVVAKWKRVVMHDKGMGRVGVGYANAAVDDLGTVDNKERVGDESASVPRSRILQPAAMTPSAPSPIQTGGPSASSSQQTSPYLPQDATRSPNVAPQAKRPRLMNGHHSGSALEGANSPSTSQTTAGNSKPWHPQQTLAVSNLTGPSGPTPPPSSSGA
ncbi:hypothetical protein BBP40_009906 [Aspergillus hancockii]|nr:hypothetical protein BBP40_009906 [Aspergillus hancockii]